VKIRNGEFYARVNEIGILIGNTKIFYASVTKNNSPLVKKLKYPYYFYP
jgi:hypothetical protein